MPQCKEWLSLQQSAQNWQPHCKFCGHLLYWLLSSLDEKCRNLWGRISFTAPKQSMAFIPPIFRKVTIFQYMWAFIYQSSLQSVNKYVQLGKISLMPISMTATTVIFTKLTLAWPNVIHNPSTEFYENPAYSFITDTRSQMDVVSMFTPWDFIRNA